MAKRQQKMKIKIISGNTHAVAELKNTDTAKAVYKALPIDGSANRWGAEIYFPIPVNIEAEPDAQEIVSEGDIAYWHEGSCFCIFWGRTPASNVNVFGKVIGDAKIFTKVKNGDLIVLERA